MKWISRLKASFGVPFLSLVCSIYWTQGFRTLPWMAISYQLKDELKLSPSASQFAMTVAFMPWSIKPIYGILSDCVPLYGSRRVSYLMISSILSFIPWLFLGLFQSVRLSTFLMIGFLTLQNMGTAMADVVIDAMIAEAARKERAEYAGDLQSMSWFAMALGGMLGSIVGGFALWAIEVKGIFLLFTIFPLLQLLLCGLIDEEALINGGVENEHENPCSKERNETPHFDKKDESVSKEDYEPLGEETNPRHVNKDVNEPLDAMGDFGYGMLLQEDGEWIEVQATLSQGVLAGERSDVSQNTKEETPSALEESVDVSDSCSMVEGQLHLRSLERVAHPRESNSLDVKQDSTMSFWSRLRGTVKVLLQTLKQPEIRQPMLWFFMAQICVPSLASVMFYYQTNHLLLDASFLGTSRLVGWGALMLGTFIYNHYLKNVQLRKIFWWTHLCLAFITLFDVLLVSGFSSLLAIPNKVFIIGTSALGDAVNQFKFMPFLVLSGRLCEPGIEGTLFALFMSLNNLGSTLSSFLGAALASILHISSNHFENLSLGICIQALCTIFPIFFLHLIPEGTGVDLKKVN